MACRHTLRQQRLQLSFLLLQLSLRLLPFSLLPQPALLLRQRLKLWLLRRLLNASLLCLRLHRSLPGQLPL
jgi:hypothetical protein